MMTSGGQGAPYFRCQEIRPGAGFETGDFVQEMLGGLTTQRLRVDEQSGWAPLGATRMTGARTR